MFDAEYRDWATAGNVKWDGCVGNASLATSPFRERWFYRESEATVSSEPEVKVTPSKVLVVDIGGTKIKLMASGQTEPLKISSGKKMTPIRMVEAIHDKAGDWSFEAVSIGYPGLVGKNGPLAEPENLGSGWVGFDFAAAFDRPVRIINDAAMQALGSYDGGRMLFVGLGTGFGSTFIADHVIVPLELGRLRHNGKTVGEVIGRDGLERLGKSAWRETTMNVITSLKEAFVADYVVIGGGNAKVIKELPAGIRRGHNLNAFRGGLRLWKLDDVATLSAETNHGEVDQRRRDWIMI